MLPFGGVGRALRVLRERADMRQDELALRAGKTQSMLSRYEREAVIPEIPTLEAFLSALGVTLHELADAVDDVQGRTPRRRAGKVVERWKADLAQEGIDRRAVWSLASGAMVGEDPRAAADLVASVVAAAEEIAVSVVERQRGRIGELLEQVAEPPGSRLSEVAEPIGDRIAKRRKRRKGET